MWSTVIGLFTKLDYKQFLIALGIALFIGVGYMYGEYCEQKMVIKFAEEREEIQKATNLKIIESIKDQKKKSEQWYSIQLEKVKAEQEVKVIYDTIIKEVPTVVYNSQCKSVGVDALRLFNEAIRTANQ